MSHRRVTPNYSSLLKEPFERSFLLSRDAVFLKASLATTITLGLQEKWLWDGVGLSTSYFGQAQQETLAGAGFAPLYR